MDEIAETRCPHCGEEIEIEVDPSGGRRQAFIEDCWVCCRPIQFEVTFDGDGHAELHAQAA
jgi:hypothetical protein